MPHREDAPPRPDNGTSYAYDGPSPPYDVPSYAAHFHRPRTTARRTRTMDRCPLTTFRRTRRISIVRGQRRVVRVRWTVVPLRRSVVRGAFPSYADNGASYAYDGPSSPYDVPSYAAHFHRTRTTARRTRTMGRRPLTTFRRTRRISIVRGQRHVVRVRWTVVRLRCSVVRGAFPPSADNGMSSPYYGASYPAHFCRLQTTTRRVHFAAGRGGLTKI